MTRWTVTPTGLGETPSDPNLKRYDVERLPQSTPSKGVLGPSGNRLHRRHQPCDDEVATISPLPGSLEGGFVLPINLKVCRRVAGQLVASKNRPDPSTARVRKRRTTTTRTVRCLTKAKDEGAGTIVIEPGPMLIAVGRARRLHRPAPAGLRHGRYDLRIRPVSGTCLLLRRASR